MLDMPLEQALRLAASGGLVGGDGAPVRVAANRLINPNLSRQPERSGTATACATSIAHPAGGPALRPVQRTTRSDVSAVCATRAAWLPRAWASAAKRKLRALAYAAGAA